MEDKNIIGLFFERSEKAIEELKKKYGSRSLNLADNILGNLQDAEECVSDAIHVLWERIPPEQPESLWAYFSRVVRNQCYSRLNYLSAAKRDRGCEVCLSELEECLTGPGNVEDTLEAKRISESINRFLDTLDRTNRILFVRRYFYFDSCADIGKRVGLTRGAVNTRLCRLRQELRQALEKEDIFV